MRVPPKSEAISLVYLNGVLPAQANPALYMLSVTGEPSAVKPAQPLQRRQLLFGGVGDVVLRQKLADRAVLTFGRGAVVAEDVDDDGVVGLALSFDLVDDAAGLFVGVLHETGEKLHQPGLERALIGGNVLPGRDAVGAWVQDGVGGDPAQVLLPGKDALAHRIPAVIEHALVGIGVCLR